SVGNENFDAQFLDYLESFLPSATSEYFGQIYQQIKDQKQGGLLSSTFLLSIFLVANGVNAIFGGFENSYHVELTRTFLRQYAYALMVGLIISILAIVGAVVYVYFEFYILDVANVSLQIARGIALLHLPVVHFFGGQWGQCHFWGL